MRFERRAAERVAITGEESPRPFERMAEDDEGDGEEAQTVDLRAVGALRDLALEPGRKCRRPGARGGGQFGHGYGHRHDLAPSQRRDYAWAGVIGGLSRSHSGGVDEGERAAHVRRRRRRSSSRRARASATPILGQSRPQAARSATATRAAARPGPPPARRRSGRRSPPASGTRPRRRRSRRRRRSPTDRGGASRKAERKPPTASRPLMDQRQPDDAERAVGMDLGGAAPEVLGETLLANEETRLGHRFGLPAKASEKATSTSPPSGRRPLRAKSKRAKPPIPAAAKPRRSASASAERRTIIASPSRLPR